MGIVLPTPPAVIPAFAGVTLGGREGLAGACEAVDFFDVVEHQIARDDAAGSVPDGV
ncbi:hypothetical protein D3C87_2011330 [compost metagenome]